MTKLLMIMAMVAVIAMAGVANAGVYLVDIVVGASPVATAADFTTGGVTGLVGTEPVDTLDSGLGAATYATAGGIDVTFGGTHFENTGTWGTLSAPQDLLRDFVYGYPNAAPMNVSIGNIDLDPSSNYTLYLWGNLSGVVADDSIFTPVNGDVTFASLTPTQAYLAVDFTTNAAWNDTSDTIDLIWDSAASLWNNFNGFAIVGGAEPIPEPAGLGLIGLALLAVRRKRS